VAHVRPAEPRRDTSLGLALKIPELDVEIAPSQIFW
jgi:hypothetical protein